MRWVIGAEHEATSMSKFGHLFSMVHRGFGFGVTELQISSVSWCTFRSRFWKKRVNYCGVQLPCANTSPHKLYTPISIESIGTQGWRPMETLVP